MTLDRLLAMAAIGFGTALAGIAGKYAKETVGASLQSFVASRAANLGADVGYAESCAAEEAAANANQTQNENTSVPGSNSMTSYLLSKH